MRIEYEFITPELRELEKELNESIRLLNCLSRQLYDQKKKIEGMKSCYKKDKKNIVSMEETLKKENEYIESLNEEILKKINYLKELKRMEFAKKRRLVREIDYLKSRRQIASERLEETKEELLRLKRKVEDLPEIMETVMYPNFKFHLNRFRISLKDYESARMEVMKKTGVKLSRVSFDDVVKFTRDGGVEIQELDSLELVNFQKPYNLSQMI